MNTHGRPVLVVEDDRVLRQLEVLLDPRAGDERVAAYASYNAHDVPDYLGWRERLRAALPGLYPCEVRLVPDQAAFEAQLPDADVAVIESLQVGAAQLARAPRLRLVQNFGRVTANIDSDALRARGVPLLTLRRRTNIALAEHALMFMLALARRLPLTQGLVTSQRIRARGLEPTPYDTRHTARANFARVPGMRMLHGLRLGLLGFGEIARELAPLARALGMEVACHQRTPLDAPTQARFGVRQVGLDEIFAGSDVVSIHLPLSDATRGLVGDAQLARMRPGSLLVNTARAEIVEQPALLRALDSGRIAGAAFDVLYAEPTTEDDPLLRYPNVLLTPHVGGASRVNGLDDAWDMLVGIQAALQGA